MRRNSYILVLDTLKGIWCFNLLLLHLCSHHHALQLSEILRCCSLFFVQVLFPFQAWASWVGWDEHRIPTALFNQFSLKKCAYFWSGQTLCTELRHSMLNVDEAYVLALWCPEQNLPCLIPMSSLPIYTSGIQMHVRWGSSLPVHTSSI